MYAGPLYENIGPPDRHLLYASTVLACLAFLVTIPIYVFYFKGPAIRARSKFAMWLIVDEKAHGGHRPASVREV